MLDLSVYRERLISEFIHIPELSCYNHNYYIGLKRFNRGVNDLLYARADNENTTEWYYLDGYFIPIKIGESYVNDYPNEIIHPIK